MQAAATPMTSGNIDSQAELQLMGDLVHETKHSEQTEETIAFATKEIAKYAKKMDFIIMGILISLLLLVGFKLLTIFLQNRKMVMGIDGAHASQWPSSGLGTAIAYAIPALAGLLGFQNKFLPVAAWMCYNFPSFYGNPYFKANTQKCLNMMAVQSKTGAQNVPGGSLSAMSLICGPQSWGSAITPPLGDCSSRCPSDGTPDLGDIVASGVSGLTNGSFVGHGMASAGGGTAAGIAGAVIMAGIQIGQSFLAAHDSNKATRDANNCGTLS